MISSAWLEQLISVVPTGLGSDSCLYPALRAGLLHAAPSGLDYRRDEAALQGHVAKILLLNGGKRRGDVVAIEIEGDGAIEVGAVDADSGCLQALENG